ncbi:Aldehyde oxidase GLOX1 [Glycine max]|uniref:Aldehyde oxidase GLOX n=1 Tax=Glycine soja TaxID=3848 RepID=A0A445KUQ1_GLYSO|nr:aldehyde oxidase GLOX1-like [Glycine soja]KAH1252294.1 Aldehyde oxidase GLOX1 [Glycine max]KHN45905.1 Galactose oxidase [Glycine soja]RZC14701.1 Aldehyde oxidase GLOX1 [Glycine soja]
MTLLLLLILLFHAAEAKGQWQLLHKNIGIVAMHMQLLHNDRVIIFDRTDFGLSNLTLPDGRCRNNPNELVVKRDCTAHSIEYDVAANTFRALFVQTNVWCSSGSVSPDGTLVQTGGFNDGYRAVRTFTPCRSCDWAEVQHGLAAQRWYATNHILPDGRQIIIGGRRQFNYEFYPKTQAKNTYSLPFLAQTNDANAENNLYPFVFLNVDGNLFIFANNRAILFDYNKNSVVRTYPQIPGGDPRCYPSTGSAVLLPLREPNVEAEVLICGGAPRGAFRNTLSGKFVGALRTCARIKITDPKANWVMETMPSARVMSDMVLLPNGDVLIVNGAAVGTAGWELGRNPVLNPFLYKPNKRVGMRFEVQNPSHIPRMYHSGAVLLRDGRVLLAGSNPHTYYNFTKVLFPTELRLEAFSPWYLEPGFSNVRPAIVSPASQTKLKYGQTLRLRFKVSATLVGDSVSVTMLAPPFNTHSFSMNQRLLVLKPHHLSGVGESTHEVEVTAPASAVLAPPGFYLLFVVHQEVPSHGIWVQMV